MNEETSTTSTPEEKTTTPEAPTAGEQTAGIQAPSERTFTQQDVDRIIADRLVKERTKADAQAIKAREDAERKAAEEQGEFRKLYEKAQQQIAETEAKLQAAEIASIKRDVAARLNMPAALASRLQGEDESAIEADAKELMAALPKPTAPNINSGAGVGNAPRVNLPAGVTEASLRDQAVRLGVNPDLYVQKFIGS
ncbi:MAG: DUF4355 domain-containing protein [Comamonadaceae bacterium]|uniref:capsid assembly scaffolding protein Gp46 family protein n=1 Tax=Candidatus Skiveiella danica TaxID=3386177 RepID=UPI00390AE6C8|nr:DUF4355 domain-containing protein [Comamonadaceae bacterium]